MPIEFLFGIFRLFLKRMLKKPTFFITFLEIKLKKT